VAAPQLAEEWVAASPDHQATALALVHIQETLNFALASLFNLLFAGATFTLFGLAVALSDIYPRWLGWIVVMAGVLSIPAGLIQAFTGEPSDASRVLTVIGPTVITLWLLAMGILLMRRAAAALPSLRDTPG
jgi:bacteriorhodopsin